jgi:hypothetical protein
LAGSTGDLCHGSRDVNQNKEQQDASGWRFAPVPKVASMSSGLIVHCLGGPLEELRHCFSEFGERFDQPQG